MNQNTAAQSTPDRAESTILIVDDEPVFLNLLGELLQPHYRVRAANSGERALNSLAFEPRPDLILLDVMMNGMDGFELLRQLQADQNTREIPVIFITALHDEDSEQRGLELGAVDYVHKPLKNLIVLSRIRAQLDAKAARDMLRKNNLRLKDQVKSGAHALEQAQKQLLQSEKMAAMGQLAAGIAHEINNPIGYVGSNLTTLEAYLNDVFALVAAYENGVAQAGAISSQAFIAARALHQEMNFDYIRQDTTDLLAETKEGIGRVRQIVRDLKDFSHVSDDDWQWADLHRGLESTLNIVWNELKYHCNVIKNYGDLPLVRCLPAQLNQVFVNLLINAAQAIEGSGTITVSTQRDGEKTVSIRIADTGKGIPPAHIERIFEPFYTTKPVGKGTGLGLSLSSSIIERHHGRIDVSSEVGKGSVFTITLPVDAVELSDVSEATD